MRAKNILRRAGAWLLSAALCLSCGTAALAANSATASTIRLEKAEGTVKVTNASAKEQTVREQMRLNNGCHVATKVRSYAWLSLDDTKAAKLDAESELEVRKRGKKLELLLDSGSISFNVSKPLEEDETMNIRTSTMVTGIRGTAGWVSVVDDGHTRLGLLTGKVECALTNPISGEAETVTVCAGETADFYVFGPDHPGNTCDIVNEPLARKDIPGFVLVGLAGDGRLTEKIYEETDGGVDLRGLTPEEAQRRLDDDEAETARKLVTIDDAERTQERTVAVTPVWSGEEGADGDDGDSKETVATAPPTSPVVPYSPYTPYIPSTPPAVQQGVYALLYSESGELVFQNGNVPDASKGAYEAYQVNLDGYTTWEEIPWHASKDTIQSVTFKDTIKPKSTAYWFEFASKLTTVNNPEKLDISEVTDMSGMFEGCENLSALDVSTWDTSNVTDMGQMFYECKSLSALDVSGWDTAHVTDINYLFGKCESLTALDVSKWNTSSVTNMLGVFFLCEGLATLDVSKWDVSSVINMNSTFHGCESLTTLDIGRWNTSNVQRMGEMFAYCKKMETFDIGNWDTSNVVTMGDMFTYCSGMTSLDISRWNTSKVTSMGGMFNNCTSLTSLDINSWDTSSVTDMGGIFGYCSSLTSLDISNWDTSKATAMSAVFYDCTALTTIYASDTFAAAAAATDTDRMFDGCTSLVGGNGTTFDANHIDGEYARIDTANAPGYFTAKP